MWFLFLSSPCSRCWRNSTAELPKFCSDVWFLPSFGESVVVNFIVKFKCPRVFRYGYGSIPVNTIFLGGWTSIYQLFWCEQRGTRFWPIPISILIHGIFNCGSTVVFLFLRSTNSLPTGGRRGVLCSAFQWCGGEELQLGCMDWAEWTCENFRVSYNVRPPR